MLVGVSRPIDSSNAQVVTSAGGVIESDTLGEQLELSTCLCAAPAVGMNALTINVEIAITANVRDSDFSSKLITERNPRLGLSNSYIFVSSALLQEVTGTSDKVNRDDFRGTRPFIISSPS